MLSESTPTAATPPEFMTVLRQRAIQLAQLQEETLPVDVLHLVQFCFSKETYALEAQYVREAWNLKEYTPLPGTPPWVRGVVNLRSQVVAVLDIGQWFKLAPSAMEGQVQLLIVAAEGIQFAIPVDSILGSVTIQMTDLQETSGTEDGPLLGWDKGVTVDRVTVLDGSKLLTDRRLLVDSGQL